MIRRLEVEEFLAGWQKDQAPLFDVRSPREFHKAHIPGATSLPLFDDADRARVGITYKHRGREEAILLGLEIVGPHLREMAEQVLALAPEKSVYLHCWRGGMRSEAVAMLLNRIGLEVGVLEGGYKAWRKYIHRHMEKPWRIQILGGKTGSGKTDILKALDLEGAQVIDLEGLANHKGSAFGGFGQEPQPSTEMFENLIFDRLSRLDPKRPIWVEDESRAVGWVNIPEAFWRQMRKAPVFFVDMPRMVRVERLVREYAGIDKNDLAGTVQRIERRLGGQNMQAALAALEKNDFASTADIVLEYYDKAYLHGLNKRQDVPVISLETREDNPKQTALELLKLESQHQPIS